MTSKLTTKLTKKQLDSDEEFLPATSTAEKSLREKKERKPRETYSIWENEENNLFLTYLQNNIEYFDTLASRRANKVFVKMSDIFENRTSHQCKSHYQKLQKMCKFASVQEIIKFLEKRLKKNKVLHQKPIKTLMCEEESSDGSLKFKQCEIGKLNIFVVKSKAFEIRAQIDLSLVEEW